MQFLQCGFCAVEWEVSEEDPDATLADGMEHLQARHPMTNPADALTLSDESRAPRGVEL